MSSRRHQKNFSVNVFISPFTELLCRQRQLGKLSGCEWPTAFENQGREFSAAGHALEQARPFQSETLLKRSHRPLRGKGDGRAVGRRLIMRLPTYLENLAGRNLRRRYTQVLEVRQAHGRLALCHTLFCRHGLWPCLLFHHALVKRCCGPDSRAAFQWERRP